MKRIAIAVSVVVFGAAILTQAQTQNAEQELIKLENEWVDAVLKHDLAFIDGAYADDFMGTDLDGSVFTKAQAVAFLKSGKFVTTSLVVSDMKVRVYGDAAVVTGSAKETGKEGGREVTDQYRWTDTLIKKSGRWLCVASHASRIAQK